MMLLKYLRDKKRQKIGMVIAISVDEIGWSKIRPGMGDKFVLQTGLDIALARAKIKRKRKKLIPQRVQTELTFMKERAKRYFKEV